MSGRWLAGALVFGLVFFGYAGWHFLHWPPETTANATVQSWLVFLGAALGFFTFVFTSYFHDRSAKAANALSALQALRTDMDYLAYARRVQEALGSFHRPVEGERFLQLIADTSGTPPPVADAEFVNAVNFLLNQYEFLAAGARLGAIDLGMLRQTIRSTTLGLALTFEPYIAYERHRAPRTWQNLVWLCGKFDRAAWGVAKRRLGPPPGA